MGLQIATKTKSRSRDISGISSGFWNIFCEVIYVGVVGYLAGSLEYLISLMSVMISFQKGNFFKGSAFNESIRPTVNRDSTLLYPLSDQSLNSFHVCQHRPAPKCSQAMLAPKCSQSVHNRQSLKSKGCLNPCILLKVRGYI